MQSKTKEEIEEILVCERLLPLRKFVHENYTSGKNR